MSENKRTRSVVLPKCNDAESSINLLSNPVLDQDHVHWLSEGHWLEVKEIARLLRYKHCYEILVTKPIVWLRLSQWSPKSLDFILRVENYEMAYEKLLGWFVTRITRSA